MCLGVPGLVVETHLDRGTPMATVDFGGVTKTVCLAYVPDAREGQYVIIHAGFAITVLDEAAAKVSLDLFEEIGIVEAVEQSDSPNEAVGS
ncbi:MAG: HypC/HybG/HupF family hydrogenase formation chaperone [Acidimicrobiales bacterium]